MFAAYLIKKAAQAACSGLAGQKKPVGHPRVISLLCEGRNLFHELDVAF
jgi:hypothetical protein